MHDEHIGEICSTCRRRDYVPFRCSKCRRQFCDEHYRSKQAHPCLADQEQLGPRERTPASEPHKQYFCLECKCRLFTVNHYYCDGCESLYCLRHRHADVHNCRARKSDGCQLI